MSLIAIEKSVGRNGTNQAVDVAVIAAALVSIGPDRGGIFAPPLTIEGLAEAIELFQQFQGLPFVDGRVDPHGQTIQRINEVLNPGEFPVVGGLRPLAAPAGIATSVDANCWTPVETSLVADHVFEWTSVAGRGSITYFQLDEQVAPRWFGALVPEGANDFDKVHIFFHPTPSQAGHVDAHYHNLGDWAKIFHYLSENMGAQFCAAATGRVLIMPLLTQAAAQDCGVFPQRWESIVGRILGMLKTGDFSGAAPPAAITSVVVSSFSSGIIYSHLFRSRANLGGRLAGVIDFDGIISSYSQHSVTLTGPAGHVIRMQQMFSTPEMLGALTAQNIFPLGQPRWGGPYAGLFSPNPQEALGQIHGTIPQTTMYVAARRAG